MNVTLNQIMGEPIDKKLLAANGHSNNDIYYFMVENAKKRKLSALNPPPVEGVTSFLAQDTAWDSDANILAWIRQAQITTDEGINLADDFYLQHKQAVLADFFLRTSLCYAYRAGEPAGTLVTKSAAIIDCMRGQYTLPSKLPVSATVGQTSFEELSTGKFKVYRIDYDSPTYSIHVRELNLSTHSKNLLTPVCALQSYVSSWVALLRKKKGIMTLMEPDGTTTAFTTSMKPSTMEKVYKNGRDSTEWRVHSDIGAILLPILDGKAPIENTKSVNVFRIKSFQEIDF